MKNLNSKKGFYLLFIVLGLVACNENIKDYTKKTGSVAANSVYIADSVFVYPVLRSPEMEVSGVDTILAKFPVYTSQPAENDIQVSVKQDNYMVQVYNTVHGTAYNTIPDSLTLKTTSSTKASLIIRKGETRSTDSIIIAYRGLMKYLSDTKGYLIPLKISSFVGMDVAIDYAERMCYLFVNVTQQNGIYFKPSESSAAITNNPSLGIFNNLNTLNFTLYSIAGVTSNTQVTLSVNNNLIAAYNSAMGTDFQSIPGTDFNQATVTLSAGATSATGSIPYKGDISTLKDKRGYVVPLEITSVQGTNIEKVNAQKVFYAIVNISDLHCDYVATESELGIIVNDRTGYNVVTFVDQNGVDKRPAAGAVPPGYDGYTYVNTIFQSTGTYLGWLLSGFSGNKLNMTIDFGKEIQNISGFRIYSSTVANSIQAVDVYYAKAAEYAAGRDNFAGGVNRGAATQYMYVKISEPITARYLRLFMTPSSGSIRITNFFIYTSN